jgi:hypothetical protein
MGQYFELETAREKEDKSLSLAETILLSWPLVIVQGFYALISLNLNFYLMDNQSTVNQFLSLLGGGHLAKLHRVLVTLQILQVIFAPLWMWFLYKFWSSFVVFFGKLYNLPLNVRQSAEDICKVAMTSHFLLLIPIFGPFAKFICNFIYLFLGLRHNLLLSPLQSFMVLVAPLFLFSSLVLGFLSVVMMLVNVFS